MDHENANHFVRLRRGAGEIDTINRAVLLEGAVQIWPETPSLRKQEIVDWYPT